MKESKCYDVYWDDLTPEAQARMKGVYHENIELTPIAYVFITEETDDSQ